MFRSSCCSWRAPRGPLLTPVRFFGKRKRRQKNLVEGGESQGEDLAPGECGVVVCLNEAGLV